MNDMSERLRQARVASGFHNVSDAVQAFGWTYSTYAGHENGHRGIKRPDLLKYAEAFGVSPDWLITGRLGNFAPAPAQPTGFSDSPVKVFTGHSDTERRALTEAARLLAPQSRQTALHEVTRSLPGFSLLENDILVIDMNPRPKDGQIVIAQITDPDTGEASTELGQFRQGLVLPPHGGPDFTKDAEETTVMGVVVASIRRP